jgi:hypothetical protein
MTKIILIHRFFLKTNPSILRGLNLPGARLAPWEQEGSELTGHSSGIEQRRAAAIFSRTSDEKTNPQNISKEI